MYDGGHFLTHMLQNASLLVECSLIVLFLMFLWTLVDVVARSVRYYSATRQSHRFLEASAGLLERGQWKGVQSIAETLNRSYVAMVYFNALQEFRTAHECVLAEQAVEAARRGGTHCTEPRARTTQAGLELPFGHCNYSAACWIVRDHYWDIGFVWSLHGKQKWLHRVHCGKSSGCLGAYGGRLVGGRARNVVFQLSE